MKLIKVVHDLRWAAGTNAKLRILENNKDNELWKKFLVYTYDQSISYGVSAPTSEDFDEKDIDNNMFHLLDELASRRITGNSARDLARLLSEQYGEIPRLVLDRSIKARISITSINKVYPGLIIVFKSMKGKDVPIEEYPVKSSIKYDGVKVFAVVRPDSIKLLTSSGAEFELDSLKHELTNATYGVYEGEMTHKEGKQIHRSTITGHLNSLLAGTKTDISDYFFRVYDYLLLEDWDSEVSQYVFRDRQNMLINIFENNFQDSWYIKRVVHHLLNTEQEVVDYFEYLISEGYEGSMNRYDEDLYVWERVDRLIKKKSIKECVLTCYGIIPHSNPLKGNIGSLQCKGVVEGNFIDVNVGSGLSGYDINCESDRYINKDIEILYNTVTTTLSGHSLFLPRFKRVVGNL
jgi:hypothetical protein